MFSFARGSKESTKGVQTGFENHGIGKFGSKEGREGALFRLGKHLEGLTPARTGTVKECFPTPTGPGILVGPSRDSSGAHLEPVPGCCPGLQAPRCLIVLQSQG